MYGNIALSILFLLTACSSTKEKKSPTPVNLENTPFENLLTIRVLFSVVLDEINQQQLRQTAIKEFANIGEVHTPEDTTIEKLLNAQKKPFAILIVEIKEIETASDEKTLPVIALSCKMYELSELAINNREWMSIVWEKIRYVEIVSDQKATTQKINLEFKSLIDEFSALYTQVNSKQSRPSFYVSNLAK